MAPPGRNLRLAAAVTAARAGLSVALIDMHVFPRDKLCGGGFTGRSMRYFREIFGAEAPAAPHLTRTSVTFCAFGQTLGTFDEVPPIHMTMRRDLDNAIVDHALASGAEDFTGQSVAEMDFDQRSVTLTDGQTLSYKVLIGADGANSQVARALYGTAFDHDLQTLKEFLRPAMPGDLDAYRLNLGSGKE